MIQPSLESQKKTKFSKKIVARTIDTITRFDLLLEIYELYELHKKKILYYKGAEQFRKQ